MLPLEVLYQKYEQTRKEQIKSENTWVTELTSAIKMLRALSESTQVLTFDIYSYDIDVPVRITQMKQDLEGVENSYQKYLLSKMEAVRAAEKVEELGRSIMALAAQNTSAESTSQVA